MKFKQLVSRLLIAGIFISSAGINSLAGTLLEGGKYETFEGNYLTVDNIIENNKVDIEIEGNTLINILSYKDLNINGYWTYQDGVGYMQLTDKTDTFKSIWHPLNKEIELNKEYTLFINITKNTMQRYDDGNGGVAKICLAADSGSDNSIYIQPSQTGIIKYVFRPKSIVNNKSYISVLPSAYNGEFEYKDFMIIEGNHIDKDVEYFEGIKSTGEIKGDNSKLEIESRNKNLFNGHLENGTYHYNTGEKIPLDSEIRSSEATPVEPGTVYTVSTNASTPNIGIYQYDKDFNFLNSDFPLGKAVTFTADKNCYFINIRICSNDLSSKIQIEKGSLKTEYIKPEKDSYKLQLKEPLRGLPDGTKDRIIKKDGQWIVERNCASLSLDGTNEEKIIRYGNTGREATHMMFRITPSKMNKPETGTKIPQFVVSDKFKTITPQQVWGWESLFSDVNYEDREGVSVGTGLGHGIDVRILKSRLSQNSVDGFKEWLINNPIEIAYALETPIYEPLNIPSSINIYEEVTYISNDSIIPANMKVTIDRTANNALETVDEALNISNINNISMARFWVNQMEESILKDELQQKLNEILSLEDVGLERKSVSANLDVYIKSSNMLSLSLDTSSITFDGYSGVEDMEMLGAVNLTINSSLPYQLNAYMPSEITNSDKSNTLPIDILNIRENSEADYKQFADTADKIVLKDGCVKGNNNRHSIDLKLALNQAHKADVYKTVIKFEAEQK